MNTPREQAQDASINPSGTIRTSVSIYFPILGVGLLLFEALRRYFRRAYDSRGTDGNVFWTYASLSTSDRFFGWIPMVFKASDDEILDRCGLDTLCYLRFLRMGQKVALAAIACSAVLFPLYATATPPPTLLRKRVDMLEKINMSNLAVGDWRLWASMAAGYGVAGFTMWLLLHEYKHYAMRRHELLSKMDASAYTVLVNDLPLKLRTSQTLEQYMRKVFPNTIHSVYVAVECSRLEDLVEEREEMRNAVEHALAVMEKNGGVRPTHREGGSWLGMLKCQKGSRGQRVDSMDFYQDKLSKLNELVAREIRSIEDAQAQLAHQVEQEEQGEVRPPPTMAPEAEQRLVDQMESQAQQQTQQQQQATCGGKPPTSSSATAAVSPHHSIVQVHYDTALRRRAAQSDELDDDDDDDEEDEKDEDHKSVSTEADQNLREHSRRLRPIRVMRRAAFISFTSLRSAQVAQQAVQCNNPVAMATTPAPHVDDVNWPNIGYQYRTRSMSQLVAAVLTAVIVIFWTIPTAFIASLATVESLRKMLPFLNDAFDKHPFLIEIFKQISPLALVGLSALAPIIFELIASREGYASNTEVSASVFTKLAYFQMIQIFFVTVIVGTVLDSLKVIVDQPKTLISMLGRSMPQQSTFFMSYVIVKTGLALTLELLRVVPLLVSLLFKCLAPHLTRRERNTKWHGLKTMANTDPFDPTSQLADAFLVMLVTLTFASIAPLACYFTCWFFFVAELVYRRQVLFVYKPTTHAMGAYWPRLYKFLIAALVVAQLTLLGLLTLKKAPIQSVFALILVVIILLFNYYVSTLFPRVATYLPLTECVHLDEVRGQAAAFGFLDDVYRQPAMGQRHPLRVDYTMLQEDDDAPEALVSPPEMLAEDQRLFGNRTPAP